MGAEPGAVQPDHLVDECAHRKIGACEHRDSPIAGTDHHVWMILESLSEPCAEVGRLRTVEHRLLQLLEDESGGHEESAVGGEAVERGGRKGQAVLERIDSGPCCPSTCHAALGA